MKIIFILISAVLASQVAQAEVKMWFGSDNFSKKFNDRCYYNINIPVLKPANEQFNAGIEAINTKWKASAYEAMGQFEQTIKDPEMCSSESGNADQWDVTFEITTPLSAQFASIVSTSYYYGGGAHGGSSREAVVFNIENGKVYDNMSTILKDSALDALKTKVESELISKYEVDPAFGWNDVKASWKSMYDIKNFYITSTGIVIYFGEYEVNSYAAGNQDVEIFWYDLIEMGIADSDLVQTMTKDYF
jgi:hypothetical protein